MSGKQEQNDLFSLINMDNHQDVWREAVTVIGLFTPTDSSRRIADVFSHTVELFRGRVKGFKKCDSGYHDLRHTTDVFITLVRLLHGMHIDGSAVPHKLVEPLLTAALLHDSGYLLRDSENPTRTNPIGMRIDRSLAYAQEHLKGTGFSAEEIATVQMLIKSTSISVKFDSLGVSGPLKAAAKTIFIADLLGQMSDRIYLEKLLLLFRDYKKAGITAFASEEDILERTLDFYDTAWQKILDEAEYDTRTMKSHFNARWNDNRDLYTRSIDNNISFLKKILSQGGKGNHRKMLRRGGIVSKLT